MEKVKAQNNDHNYFASPTQEKTKVMNDEGGKEETDTTNLPQLQHKNKPK